MIFLVLGFICDRSRIDVICLGSMFMVESKFKQSVKIKTPHTDIKISMKKQN